MRTSPAAVTALAGSLLLPFLMLGSAQALTSAPDLKNVMSTTHIGTVTPVRAGGGGFGGGGGRMSGMGGGQMGGMGGRMGGFAGRVHGGPTFAGRGFNNGHSNDRHFVNNNRHFVNDRRFNNRRFVNNRFFVAGGPWWWGGYNNSCWWWTGRRWVWACY
jgi:hypothetical protein